MRKFINSVITLLIIVGVPIAIYFSYYIPLFLKIISPAHSTAEFFFIGFLTSFLILCGIGLSGSIFYGIYSIVDENNLGGTIVDFVEDAVDSVQTTIKERKSSKEKINKQDGQMSVKREYEKL